jgi:anti-sigma regulatory factor (Ser/Thr protein kinase)
MALRDDLLKVLIGVDHRVRLPRQDCAGNSRRMPDGLMLRIWDFAPTIDPAKIQPRKLEDLRPGGLGTHFIRAVVDDASFIPLPDGEGNLLELVKRKR